MPNSSEVLGNCRATRCTVCDGKFGLVHYYSWQTPLCSKKCVERFRARRESDRNWVGWHQLAIDPAREPREGIMTFQISRRGKEYLETAQTLLRALKNLADDYQRRAEKVSYDDAAKALVRPAAKAEYDWP